MLAEQERDCVAVVAEVFFSFSFFFHLRAWAVMCALPLLFQAFLPSGAGWGWRDHAQQAGSI